MDKVFIDGLIAKKPNERAPEFIIAKLSVKVEEFKRFLDEHNDNGWVNFEIHESKDKTKFYPVLDTYKPQSPIVEENIAKLNEARNRAVNTPRPSAYDEIEKFDEIPF